MSEKLLPWTLLAISVLAACGDDDAGLRDASAPCAVAADCDDGVFCNGMESCDPGDPAADARGCVPGTDPCVGGTCAEGSRSCDGACVDADSDGEGDIACGGTDCDDSNPNIYAGATEICDLEGVDEDCDPTTFGDRDLDGDRFVDFRCCNGSNCGTDCDETRAGTNPVVPEVCDGRDNDCDGMVDEELLQSVFTDADRDLHGDPESPTMACPGRAGTSASQLDCNDGDPYANTPQVEIIDGVDNDCDDIVDEDPQAVTWYVDADGDGFGDPGGATLSSSTVQEGYSLLPFDCDDADGSRSPLATELCNGVDDDCDGEANLVLGVNDWEDDDGDGFPDASCASGANADCDDTDPSAHPGHAEVCGDHRDNDCDGTIDEGCGSMGSPDGGVVPSGDAGGGPAVDAGSGTADMGPPYCSPAIDVVASSGTGTTFFTVAESIAEWTVTGNATDGWTGTLTVTLSEHGNVCGVKRAGARYVEQIHALASLVTFSRSAPPSLPATGSYDLLPNGTPLPEDSPRFRQPYSFAYGFYFGHECSPGTGTAPTDPQVGTFTLTTSTPTTVAGSFSYTEASGFQDLSGSFSAPILDCTGPAGLPCCMMAPDTPAP